MTMTSSPATGATFLRQLADVTVADASQVGRKAAVLGELLQAGFPVPEGFVLTTDALRQALGQAGRDGSRDMTALPVPEPVAAELRGLGDYFGDAPLAVRSSGVGEDSGASSFAGQYESVLGVTGAAPLVAAVRQCWASAFSDRVSSYAAAREADGAAELAVLVQRLVPAEAAGVCFSANPVTGRPDESVISAVAGLADELVSGAVSGDEWIVRDGAARLESGDGTAISAATAAAVSALARRVAGYFGAPQDIEWASAGGVIWLVQARPITAMAEPAGEGTPIPVEVPPGTWKRDPFSRRPWRPLQVSVFQRVLNQTSPRMGAFGLTGGIVHTQIGGWTYTRMTQPAGDIGAHVGSVAAAVAADEPWHAIQDWYAVWQPQFAGRSAALRDTELRALSDDELVRHFDQVEALLAEVCDRRFLVSSAGLFLMGELGYACHELLGWSLPQTLRLVTGLPSMTTEPSFRLADIARTVRADPAAVERLCRAGAAAGPDAAAELRACSPGLATATAAYIEQYGHRILGVDVSEPSLAEQPWVIVQLLADLANGDYDPQAEAAESERARQAAIAEARAGLAGRSEADRSRFERALSRAERAQPVRDDKAFTIAVVRALFRYAALEMGRRLASRGAVASGEDAFFLDRDELAGAVSGRAADLTPVVARRRAEYAWASAHRGPLVYADPAAGAAPGPAAMQDWLKAMPPEVREVMAVIFWIYQAAAPAEHGGEQAEGCLRGIAASAGVYTGPVRVIRDETEFAKVRNFDVLVCPETTPQWSMLFPKLGALITDTGGLLSHPAIIAREYRIPAVLATGNGTEVLRDGQLVTVDGTAGRVELAPAGQPGGGARAHPFSSPGQPLAGHDPAPPPAPHGRTEQ